MKLYDCFIYFNEEHILDLRLNVLNKYVDKFVIAEATRDHSGKEKKLSFNLNNFQKFKDKIKYIVVDDIPVNVKSSKKGWADNHMRDQHQRNALASGYIDCNEDDLIMISDVDVIPNPEKIKEFNAEKKYACFIQKNFHLKINLLNVTENLWMGTKICKKKFLKSPQWLRNIKTAKPAFWKFYKPSQPQIINDGGWHFSFLRNAEEISEKIKTYSHMEYNKPEFTNVEKIQERIKNRTDIFDRNYKYEKIELNHTFPKYILDNEIKFRKWII